MLFMIALLVIVGFALYVMTPAERGRARDAILARLRSAKDEAMGRLKEADSFHEALVARTPLLLVTPAIAGLSALVFLFMLFGSGALRDPQTLIAWGGNYGPRTTNGEWWRLVSSTFVHGSLFALLVNLAGFAQAGMLLERLLGPLAVAAVYLTTGMFASLQIVSSDPVAVSVGASGAVFGIYGLLFATLMWSVLQSAKPGMLQFPGLRDAGDTVERLKAYEPSELGDTTASSVEIPLKALKELAPAAGIFLLYHLADGITTAKLSGLVAGFVCGLVLAKSASEGHAPVPQVAAATVTALIVVAAASLFMRGIADVRPEIARVVALEDRTASEYEKAVAQFKKGTLSAKALAQVIDKSIVPELQAAQARLKAVNGVPAEHQPLVKNAEEYFRLRDESWRLRVDALNKSNMGTLRAADRTERASLEALERIRPVDPKPVDQKPVDQK